MPDGFADRTPGLSSPADDFFAITPHDSNELEAVTRAIEVQVAGNIACVTNKGRSITKYFTAGYHSVRLKKVLATGTTATGLFGYV